MAFEDIVRILRQLAAGQNAQAVETLLQPAADAADLLHRQVLHGADDLLGAHDGEAVGFP